MYHHHKLTGFTALGAAMLMATSVASAAVPEVCASCHNEDGVTTDPAVPTLAGNAAFFLEGQMILFKDELRPCVADYFAAKEGVDLENHCVAVADLTEDDFADIAAHYEELPYKPFEQEFDAELAAAGEAIHMEDCDSCHTEAGSQAFDEAGILAGQPIGYLVDQLKHYKEGTRDLAEMQEAAAELSEDDMKALAHFYAREGLERF